MVAEVLKDYGYSTAAFGNGTTPQPWRPPPSASLNAWPTGYGFEYFYGFGGEASQYEPNLVRNTTIVDHPHTSGGDDYATSSEISPTMPRSGSASTRPSNPTSPSSCTGPPAPFMVPTTSPKSGPTSTRASSMTAGTPTASVPSNEPKKLGWIPANTQLTPRHETMASWDSIPEGEKPFQRRLMEVCAGFTEHVDVQINRLFDEVDSLGYGDNTLIFYIWGDGHPPKAKTEPSAN